MARRAVGVTVSGVYGNPSRMNVWANLIGGAGVPPLNGTFTGGFIKVEEISTDGVTNTFDILVSAEQNGTIEVETSGTTGGTDERIFRVWKPNS